MSESLLGEDSPFEKCEDCGTVHVRGVNHSCKSDEVLRVDTSAERQYLSDRDHGDPDDDVVISPNRGRTAYHEVEHLDDGSVRPACDAELANHADVQGRERSWVVRDRGTIRSRSSTYPCRSCHDLDL